jgi:hypothetical protein
LKARFKIFGVNNRSQIRGYRDGKGIEEIGCDDGGYQWVVVNFLKGPGRAHIYNICIDDSA